MRNHVARLLLLAVFAATGAYTAACGGTTKPPADKDAAVSQPDGMVSMIDAAPNADADTTPDAMITYDAPPSTGDTVEMTEITPAAGKVSGGGNTVDVMFGHWFSQQPASGGGNTVEGASAIK
jgi:hypothetical protein